LFGTSQGATFFTTTTLDQHCRQGLGREHQRRQLGKFAYTFSVYLRVYDILIISMNVKCPKKTNRWVHLGRLLAFYKRYGRKLIDYTKENHPETLPMDEWWVVTYSVSSAINLINITFALLQRRLLLLAQQDAHTMIGSLITMFNIEIE
jgi:hypothetical protein